MLQMVAPEIFTSSDHDGFGKMSVSEYSVTQWVSHESKAVVHLISVRKVVAAVTRMKLDVALRLYILSPVLKKVIHC